MFPASIVIFKCVSVQIVFVFFLTASATHHLNILPFCQTKFFLIYRVITFSDLKEL